MTKRTKPKVFLGLLCVCKRMFSIFLLFLATLLLSSASVFSQQKNQKIISIDFKEYSLTRALHEINRLSGDLVNFREEVVMKELKKITLKRDDITVFEAVKACLEGTGLTCSQQGNGKILVGPKQETTMLTVSGRVVDERESYSRSDGTYPGNHSRGSHGWRGSLHDYRKTGGCVEILVYWL